MIKKKKHMRRKTKVYSLKYGVGEVTGVLKLYDGVEDYIEIKFNDDEIVRLFPADRNDQFRQISSLTTLTQNLKSLADKINSQEETLVYKSTHRIGVDVDLLYIINIIASLSNSALLSDKEKITLAQCLDSLILEVSHVFKINESSARGIVSDYMRCA